MSSAKCTLLALLYTVACTALSCRPASAASRTFLVLALSPETNLLTSIEPAAVYVRSLVAPALVSTGSTGSLEPGLASAFSIDAKTHIAYLTVSKELHFSDGTRVRGSDITSSLSACTIDATTSEISDRDLQTTIPLSNGNGDSSTLSRVSTCPIVSERLRQLFGASFGLGTSLGGATSWIVTANDPGRRVVLERNPQAREERIEIRVVPYLATALEQLSRGTADGILLNGDPNHPIPPLPETILMKRCLRTTLLVRRDYELLCQPGT